METLQGEATFQRGNEPSALRSLMRKSYHHAIGDVAELRKPFVPLMSLQTHGCTIRTKLEMASHRARLFAGDFVLSLSPERSGVSRGDAGPPSAKVSRR